ncbi:uncharacterized protein LOC135150451 [Daucus carota subsp. sativus]|uniref:uncharacterized protein LOC135150451 n=1 Tax=Daucus carota subsp. sativus TaxID=79200 RepID=UPI00308320A0
MKVFMKAQGVWGAVEQKDPEVTVDERTVQVALAAIYQGLPEDILLTIAEKETAKEAWEAIKTMSVEAERVQEAKVQTLKGEFESLTMKDTENIDDFYPEKFLQIASNIEQFGDMKVMMVEELVGRLKAHEERMKGKSENTSGQLLLTQKWKARAHGGLDGWNGGRDKSKIKCYNCNIFGHYAAE